LGRPGGVFMEAVIGLQLRIPCYTIHLFVAHSATSSGFKFSLPFLGILLLFFTSVCPLRVVLIPLRIITSSYLFFFPSVCPLLLIAHHHVNIWQLQFYEMISRACSSLIENLNPPKNQENLLVSKRERIHQ
jgi:hypothetical protein